MRPGRQPAVLWTTIIAGLVALTCDFAPEVASGSLACGPGGTCPRGLSCSASQRCCAPGDRSDACLAARAAGGPGDAGADAPVGTPAVQVRRLIAGPVRLADIEVPCMASARPGNADRWCAVTRGKELWVVDINQGLRQEVRCDGSDPFCLRLSTEVFAPADSSLIFVTPHFHGDMLVFSAEPRAPVNDVYRGGIFAWVPGWNAARRLTSENGLICHASDGAPIAFCLDQGAGGQIELLLGSGDPAAPLVRVKTLASANVALSLPASGSSLIFQEYNPDGGPSAVWRAPIRTAADPATHVLLHKEALLGWRSSRDGQALYFRRSPPGGNTMAATLSVLELANPSVVVDIAERAGYVEVLETTGPESRAATLQDLNDGVGLLKLFAGRVTPRATVVGPSTSGFAVSRDGRYTLLRSLQDPATNREDLRVADNERSTVCALQRQPRTVLYIEPPMSDNGELVFWSDHPDPTQLDGEGWMARARGCAEAFRFASRLYLGSSLGDRGLLYMDESNEDRGVLRVVEWTDQMWWPPGGATILDGQADYRFKAIEPDRKLVVFSSLESGREGLYAAELPF